MLIDRNEAAERASRMLRSEHDDDDDAPTVVMRRHTGTPRAFERIATASDYSAFVAAAGAAPLDRDAAVRRGLDDLRDRFSGPYEVGGVTVSAAPMFRMNRPRPAAMTNAVWAAARRVGVNPNPIIWGQGTPKQLVEVTQALIDAGHLPSGPGDLAARIRKMQWDHGIGVDCAGWCKEALLATSPKVLPLHAPGMESFRDLDGARARSFARVPVEELRPGDLVTLDPLPPETIGHNVIVYGRDVATEPDKRALATLHGSAMRAFLSSPGPHHVIEVDSSWGAGPSGADHGGFRRDTWIYDASTKTWGSFEPEPPRPFVTSTEGPAGDKLHGGYRAR